MQAVFLCCQILSISLSPSLLSLSLCLYLVVLHARGGVVSGGGQPPTAPTPISPRRLGAPDAERRRCFHPLTPTPNHPSTPKSSVSLLQHRRRLSPRALPVGMWATGRINPVVRNVTPTPDLCAPVVPQMAAELTKRRPAAAPRQPTLTTSAWAARRPTRGTSPSAEKRPCAGWVRGATRRFRGRAGSSSGRARRTRRPRTRASTPVAPLPPVRTRREAPTCPAGGAR